MKITDLNIDCLEKIVRQLDYVDIFNVAESNLRLREAAKLAYRIKYWKTGVKIGRIQTNPIEYYHIHDSNCAYIGNLKIAFKLLRYFENSIPNLIIFSINFKSHSKLYSQYKDITCARLITYDNQYHSEFLTSIAFYGSFSTGIEFKKILQNIETPFLNVKSIEMRRGFDFNRHFLRLFPNIQKMLYEIAEHTQITRINDHFPYLKSADFSLMVGNRSIDMKMLGDPKCLEMIPHMASFLRLNPQIRSLSTFFIFSETFLDAISESVPLLENLELSFTPSDIFNFGGKFENLKRIKCFCRRRIGYYNNVETVSKRMKRVLSLNQLEEFVCFNFELNNQDLYEILNRYPSIVKLKILNTEPLPNSIDPLELAAALPKLAEIDFLNRFHRTLVDDPILFTLEIKSLKKFSFRYYASGERYEDFLKRLPTGWCVTKIHQEFNEVTIERKM